MTNSSACTADWLMYQTKNGVLYAVDFASIQPGGSSVITRSTLNRDLLGSSLDGLERWEAEHGLGRDDL